MRSGSGAKLQQRAALGEIMGVQSDDEKRPARRWLTLAIRLLAPVLLVIVLWKMGDPERLWATIRRASPWPFIAALALNALVNQLKVSRWQLLLRSRGFHYPLRRCWAAVLPSLYLGAITPGRVGDVLRVQYVSHDLDAPYAEGLAVTVMDRFCDLYVLAAFVGFGIAHFAPILSPELSLVTWAAVAVATLAPLSFLIPGLSEKTMGPLYRRLTKGRQFEGGFERFLTALRAQVGRVLVVAVPLTIAAFVTNYAQGWLVGRALGIPIHFVDIMAMMAITSLLGLMPISISGLGVRELFLAVLFPFLGWTAEEGVAFGLLIFVTIYLFNVLAGFVAWQIAPPPFEWRKAKG